MEWVEVTARTVDEAREKALDLLGVEEGDTELEVLAEPKMGLFGRLREEARVRARLLPAVPRSKDDKPRQRRGAGRGPKDSVAADSPPPAGPGPAVKRPAARVAAVDRGDAGNEPKDEPKMEPTMVDDRVEVPVAEQAEVAKRFVEGLLATMEIEGAATEIVLLDESTAEVRVTGEDLGTLIGPKGATLLALQDLARTVVQRQTSARSGRLLLDVAGYRQMRKEKLEHFTKQVAQDVLASGTPAAFEPMAAADRKIIHDTANAIEGISTSSEGEDPRRHVVVHPA